MSNQIGNPQLIDLALGAVSDFVGQTKIAAEKAGFVDPATMQGGGMPPGMPDMGGMGGMGGMM